MICPGCGRQLGPGETCAGCAAGAVRRPVVRPLVPLCGDETPHGRASDVERLRALIARDGVALIVLHAAAGVGRTSLLDAGLLPALDPALHRPVRVPTAMLVSGGAASACAVPPDDGALPVIVLDPLEDLFAAEAAPLAELTAALLALLEGPRRVKVLLSIRTELRPFLQPLESALGDRAQSYELAELGREPLALALIAAAEKHPAPFLFTRWFPERLADEVVWASRGGAGGSRRTRPARRPPPTGRTAARPPRPPWTGTRPAG